MRTSTLLTCVLLMGLFGCNRPDPDPLPDLFPNDGILANQGDLNALKAVGQYKGQSSCTAVFVKFSDNLNAPAYVLTNGHCSQYWDPNAVYRSLPVPDHSVTFNLFQNVPAAERVTVAAKQIAYSTMKGTDLAIVELAATVGDLNKRGINPLPIANALPDPGSPIRIVGVPVNDIPTEQWLLRQTTGTQGSKTNLIEFVWTWWAMYANNAPGIVGGHSGSPVMRSYREGVAGLINTTTNGGTSPCYLGHPCELTPQGAVPRPNTNYMLSVLDVPGCIDANGNFDLNTPTCKLDKGNNVTITGYPLGAINPDAVEILGQPRQRTLNTTVSGYDYYRYKLSSAGTFDPSDPNGYSNPARATTLINDSLPKAEGQYTLAVIGGNMPTFDQSWQQPAHATVGRIEIDRTPPTLKPDILVRESDTDYIVTLLFAPPELSNYVYKFGKPPEVNASNPKGYQTYRRVPVQIPKASRPVKLVVIGYDNAGNATQPVERLFE